jgi:hypothetical protein
MVCTCKKQIYDVVQYVLVVIVEILPAATPFIINESFLYVLSCLGFIDRSFHTFDILHCRPKPDRSKGIAAAQNPQRAPSPPEIARPRAT